MKSTYRFVIIAVFISSLLLITPQYAYSEPKPFTIKTDKEVYSIEETIHVCGTVPVVLEGVPVTMQVFNPRNVMYTVGQKLPNADGIYDFDFKIGGGLGIVGDYTIKTAYLGRNVQTTITFGDLTATTDGVKVEFGGNVFYLPMSLTNGNVQSYEINTNNTSIVFSISTCETEDGEFHVMLQRALIDARNNDQDQDFIVLINGKETNFEEISTTSTERTLVIPVPTGAKEVVIIGTSVIPEFPVNLMVITAIGLIGVLIALRMGVLLNKEGKQLHS